jgi:hypothetical protein
VIGAAVNVADAVFETVPEVGEVCVMVVVLVPGEVTVSVYVQVPVSPYASESVPVTVYGEFEDESGPVVPSTSPPVTVKPDVDVAKVTAPWKPEAAVSVLVKVALALALVDPEVGGPWAIVSGVTLSVYVQVPVSPYASESVPVTVYGEFDAESVPVVARTLPPVTVKPGVVVAKVTVPTKPEVAAKALVKAALPATSVVPEVGAAWTIVSGVTVKE